MSRIKAVEREYLASRFAADRLLDQVREDPTTLARELQIRDLQDASDRLEGTYIIRLFAEFETSLRAFWSASRKKPPPSRTRDLMDGVAAKRRVPNDWIADAHAVRDYRNLLVHEGEEEPTPIPIDNARGNLCRFLSLLPIDW